MKKYLTLIIEVLLLAGCATGYYFCSKAHDAKKKAYHDVIDSLPELTTTRQILQAVNGDNEQLYLINNYQFPKFIPASVPYDLVDGKYVYVSVTVYEKKSDGKSHEVYNKHGREYGRLFFNDTTELLNVKGAFISTNKHDKCKRNGYEYSYSMTSPDANVSFIALLGNNKAILSGVGGDRMIVTGDKSKLFTESMVGYWFGKIGLIIAFGFFLLAIFAEIGAIRKKNKQQPKKKKKKSNQNKQSNQLNNSNI